jgi:hypothetical protein
MMLTIRSQVGGSQLDAKVEAVKSEQRKGSIGEYEPKSDVTHDRTIMKSE